MPMRLSGLMSGMDTETIISQLVEARKTKVTKAVKAQKSLKYKQDAWKDLNKQILNLYNKSLGNMRFESAFIKKTTKISDSSVVSVITGEGAMNGVQSLKVDNLAKTAFLTGGEVKNTVKDEKTGEILKVTGTTKIGDLQGAGLGSTAEESLTGRMTVEVNGTKTSITVGKTTTIDSFIGALRNAGLNANFDSTNQRIFVSSKTSGKDSDFSIIANDEAGLSALTSLGLSYDSQTVRDSYAKIFGAQNPVIDDAFRSAVLNRVNSDGSNALTDADKKLFEAYEEALATNPAQKFDYEKLSDNGKKVYYNYLVSESVLNKTVTDKQEALYNSLKDEYNTLTSRKPALEAKHTELVDKIKGNTIIMSVLNGKLAEAGITAEDGFDKAKYDALDDEKKAAFDRALEEGFKAAGAAGSLSENDRKALADLRNSWEETRVDLTRVTASLDLVKGKLDFEADNTTVKGLKTDVSNSVKAEVETAAALYGKLEDAARSSRAGKTSGEDARIRLNDVEYTSSKNTFEINSLTLTVSSTTEPNEVVTITTEDDTQGVYDMVKNFFKEYNTVINQMDKYYNADSAKDYEPLTDEEKEAMSDSAIEEWENKIKDSILRKDTTLGYFASEMKRIMMEGVEVNGKKMYLSNFGIGTMSYFLAPENERNAYHIDGDPDDASTSGNADKLKSMIANDPDTVVSFFTKLSKNLYDRMFEMMKGTENSSAFTAYEDKKMKEDYDDYTTKIKELEKKLADYEDKWYAKFAAMETALAKMQERSSAVTSLLGGG